MEQFAFLGLFFVIIGLWVLWVLEIPKLLIEQYLHKKAVISADSYVQKFLKSGITGENSGYTLSFFIRERYRYFCLPGFNQQLYCDANLNFLLVAPDSCVVAQIGFEAEKGLVFWKIKKLIIKQIQGVRGKEEVLKKLRWEKLLVQAVIDWGKNQGVRRFEIMKAEENHYWWGSNTERKKRLFMHYDVTAKRMGFKPGGKSYVLDLKIKMD